MSWIPFLILFPHLILTQTRKILADALKELTDNWSAEEWILPADSFKTRLFKKLLETGAVVNCSRAHLTDS